MSTPPASRTPPTGVGLTAVAVAMARARESASTDPLFRDLLAQHFVDAAEDSLRRADASGEWEPLLAWVDLFFSRGVVRTRFIDDCLIDATMGPCTQVVLLGAGLDTRAFRLPWPAGVRLFEIDLPSAFAFKEHVLVDTGATPICSRRIIEADLRVDLADHLADSPFERTAATAWVAEGVLPYLTIDEARQLLETVSAHSAPGSRLIFEHAGTGSQATTAAASSAHALSMPGADRVGALFKGGLGPTGPEWLSGQGWIVDTHDRAAVGLGYGRSDHRLPGGAFVTATRR